MRTSCVKGTEITQESREQIFRSISQETITRFLNDVTIDYSRVKDPTAYLQTSLYTYHQKLLLQSSQDASANADTPDRPLADWEKIWLAQMADARRRRKKKQSLEANTQKTKNKNIAGHDERHGLWSCLQNQNFCLLHPRTTFLSFFFYRTFALPHFYGVYDNRNSANRNIVFQLYGKQVKIIKPLPLKLL